jgi:hypothetical protein
MTHEIKDIFVMRSEPKTEPDILLWLLCMQIDGNDVWDDLLRGLNEKGQNDIINFVHDVIYDTGKKLRFCAEYNERVI